jgi:hypothetical protein
MSEQCYRRGDRLHIPDARRISFPDLLQPPALTFFPHLAEVLYRSGSRWPILPQTARRSINFVGGGERRV